jgi:hypothetical protein
MKLRIGKTVYTVSFPDVVEPSCITGGRVNYTEKTIQVAARFGKPLRKLSDKRRDHILWHEITHAILKDMGSRKEKDEVFVDALAKRIWQVTEQLE